MLLNAVLLVLSSLPSPPSGAPAAGFTETSRCPLEALPASFSSISESHADRGDSDVLVIVSSSIQTPLADRIDRFRQDLEAEGFNVTVEGMLGGTAADLRAQIQSHAGRAGVILVGWLPAAWYEMDEWGGPHEEFPLDLYLMDLDGIWTDADNDGMFDSHSGDRGAEIWVGRIDAHAIEFGSEVTMMRDFFDKNHFYRTGALAVPARAMAFNDDDWSYYGECGLSSIYPTVDVYSSPDQTTAAYYRDRLAHGYEFIHLMSHSSPWGHTFKTSSGYSGTVMAPEIAEINPQTVFIQLFSCSNCRWTEPNCLGNWYLFGEDYCQLAIGSTKTGSMLDFEVFYEPIGAGAIPGAAFMDWMNEVGIYDEAWHYGCVLLGDPTVMPMGGGSDASLPPGGGSPEGGHGRSWAQVSSSIHSDCYPTAAVNGDIVWVAWMTGATSRLDIAARRFDGTNWGPVLVVDTDEYWDVQPSIAFDGAGQAWLAWSSFEESSYGYDIRLAHGTNFSTVTTVVNGTGYDVDPRLAYAGGRLWMAWQTWRRGEGDIMVEALDGSFAETIISGSDTEDFSPACAADGSGWIHVAWVRSDLTGDRIMWTRGNGSGFAAPQEVSTGNFCRAPALAVVNGQVHLAWQEDDGGSDIRTRCWNGSSWEQEEVVFSSPSETACIPSIGSSPTGAPLVAWQQGKGSAARLWSSTLTSSGWTTAALLLDTEGPAWTPFLSDGVIAWAGNETGSNWDVWVSLEGGLGVESPEQPADGIPVLLANPVRSIARIAVPADTEEASVRVFDITGRLAREVRSPVAGGVLEISCDGLPDGTYLLSLELDGRRHAIRMTVLR